MASTKKTTEFPALHRPDRDADSGKVRLGDGFVTDEFPQLRRPDRNADKGKVRLGDGFITGQF
jgi:hypothetical protein